jgi:CRAL/TRIO domain
METESEAAFTKTTSEKIIDKIKTGDSEYIFNGLCKYNNNELYLDFIFFKHFASVVTYDIVLSIVTNNINAILNTYNTFTVHANLKYLTMTDIDKHRSFISILSTHLKERYPNKLERCNIYNSPLIFSQLYNIVSLFIDRETQKKIKLV